MARILVVEDSRAMGNLLRAKIESDLGMDVTIVPSYQKAEQLIEKDPTAFVAALLDLVLPDAPQGEIVDLVVAKGIPSIVFTGDFTARTQETIWGKGVADYVLKEGCRNLDYVVALIRRLQRNKSVTVLLVDDSNTFRRYIRRLLETHQYRVLEARGGTQALALLEATPQVSLVITDYNMPKMDGFELARRIRSRYSREDLAIIGISAEGQEKVSARFIKAGANDFINKPFSVDEFYCRLTQNIELIECIRALREASIRDPLTGLYNRRHFFDAAAHLCANVKRRHLTGVLAMIDIDHFKQVNDSYGHHTGDLVLQHLSSLLQQRFRESDIVARLGGEEFCVFASNMDPRQAHRLFDELRAAIEQSEVLSDDAHIRLTVSIGLSTDAARPLDILLREADENLYEAKRSGRNRVVTTQK